MRFQTLLVLALLGGISGAAGLSQPLPLAHDPAGTSSDPSSPTESAPTSAPPETSPLSAPPPRTSSELPTISSAPPTSVLPRPVTSSSPSVSFVMATLGPSTSLPPIANSTETSTPSTPVVSSSLIITGCLIVTAAVGIWIFRKWKLRPSRTFKEKITDFGNQKAYQEVQEFEMPQRGFQEGPLPPGGYPEPDGQLMTPQYGFRPQSEFAYVGEMATQPQYGYGGDMGQPQYGYGGGGDMQSPQPQYGSLQPQYGFGGTPAQPHFLTSPYGYAEAPQPGGLPPNSPQYQYQEMPQQQQQQHPESGGYMEKF